MSLIVISFGLPARAQTPDDKDAQRERKTQIFVTRLGVGEKSRVWVKVKDKKGITKGFISQINDESFVITDRKTGVMTTLQYSQVRKINRLAGNALYAVFIGVGIASAVLLTVVVVQTVKDFPN